MQNERRLRALISLGEHVLTGKGVAFACEGVVEHSFSALAGSLARLAWFGVPDLD